MPKMKLKLVLRSVAIASTLAASCWSASAQETFKVGIVSFLSGQAAESFGIPAVNGAKVLVEAFNKGQAPAPYNKKGFGGMLPLKFGYTASSTEDVEKVLEQAYIQLRTYLDRLQGKIELVIQATWELPKILHVIVKNNPALVGADPVETGRLIFEAAEGKKRKFVTAIHDKLSPLSNDYLDASLNTEAMIFNRSYLVDKEQEMLFDVAVDEVATEFEEVLAFKYIGPLPIYSFVNIELNQGNFLMVDKSRKVLQLPDKTTWEAIKLAYRQLLLAHHPDRHSEDPQAAARTKEVVQAYEVVAAYCQSLPGFCESKKLAEISFAKEAVEQTFIIDNKGAVLARSNKVVKPA